MLFRRAPFVVAYWRDDDLIVENYRSGTSVAASPSAVEILNACDRWQSVQEIARRVPDYPVERIAEAIGKFRRLSLVDASTNTKTAAGRRQTDLWAEWHPAAGLLHFSSKDLTYRAPEITRAVVRARARREPMPAIGKRYPRAEQTRLPPPERNGEFARVVLERRTWRRFGRAPIALADLATVLGLSCGIQYWLPVKGIGKFALTTYPSGGAQHPLEVYVVARRVDGLRPGVYHYGSATHRLSRIRTGATARDIARYVPKQPWYGGAAALLLITAVFPRTQWKYRFSRAYKVVLAEAGHLCQNICLTATWLGLAPFCTMALADSTIERDLKIDGVTESVIYAAGVATRPPGVDWAPWPTSRRVRRTPGPLAR